MNNDRSQSKDERDLGVFIPSFLDDYGLDPYEFRVYSHIARRAGSGVCFEGLKAIGRCCLMDVKTVRQKVAVLIDMGMLRCVEHIGRTHEFTLTRHSEWKHPETIPDVRLLHTPTKTGRGTRSGTTKTGTTRSGIPPLPEQVAPPTRSGTPPLPDLVPKGDPIKGIPIRASNEGERDLTHEESDFSCVEVMEPENAIAESTARSVQAEVVDEVETPVEDKGSAAPGDVFEKFRELYNREKPQMWAAIAVMSEAREKVLKALIKTTGGVDNALTVLSNALAYARTDSWGSTKNLSFDNFATNGKILSWHERYLSQPVTNAGMRLTEGDAKMAQRFASRAEWFLKKAQ